MAAFMTERSGSHVFRELKESAAPPLPAGFETRHTPEDLALEVARGEDSMILFAGRQVATAERIEILALTTDADIDDGLSASATVRSVLNAGGVPVLSWAPGKWCFKRSKVVSQLLDEFDPAELLIGDTTLRPLGYPEPPAMKREAARGREILAGSDPLPITGEEAMMGKYVTVFDGDIASEQPVTSARRLLVDPSMKTLRRGRRGGIAQTALRLYRNAVAAR